jgi:hypothetical protein
MTTGMKIAKEAKLHRQIRWSIDTKGGIFKIFSYREAENLSGLKIVSRSKSDKTHKKQSREIGKIEAA